MISVVFFVIASLVQDPATEAIQAKQAMDAGDFPRAIKLYRDLDRSFPQNLDIKRNLALALHSAGRYAEALHRFEQILQRAPEDRASLLFSGIDRTALHDAAGAIPSLTKFLGQEPQNAIALVARGRAYLTLNDFASAIRDFSSAAGFNPQNLQAWEGLGKSYLGAARQAFESIEANGAFSAEWYGLLARSALNAGDFKRAFQLFRVAEARSPDLPGIHSGLAEVYRQTNHSDWAATEEAREVQAVRTSANGLRRHYLDALQFQRQTVEVLARLAQSRQSSEYHELMGLAYRMQGRDTESAAEVRQALELSPNSTAIRTELATSLWLAGDCNAAMPVLKELLRADSNSAEANHVIGECLVASNNAREAVPYLTAALKQDAQMLPAEAALGRAYFHLGDYNNAVTHLRKVVTFGDPTVLVQLAGAYRKLGDEGNYARYLDEYKRHVSGVSETNETTTLTEITPP